MFLYCIVLWALQTFYVCTFFTMHHGFRTAVIPGANEKIMFSVKKNGCRSYLFAQCMYCILFLWKNGTTLISENLYDFSGWMN